MNKKAESIIGGIIGILIAIAFLVFITFMYGNINNEISKMKEYKNFCNERPAFCYCDLWGCEYNTQWNSLSGLSKETKELCSLAERLNDSKMIFKAGCNR